MIYGKTSMMKTARNRPSTTPGKTEEKSKAVIDVTSW
jgi:hypothetical protein